MLNSFGPGQMWMQRNDIANATPLPIGLIQEVAIDFSWSTKPLFGSNQFPALVARGTAKVTGKAKFARIFGRQLNDILFGTSTAVGVLNIANNEAGTIGSTPFQVNPANAATFVDDLGVAFALNAVPLQKVASAPATGQYAVTGAAVGATSSFATNVMTCTVAPTSGAWAVGQSVTSAGVTPGTFISALGTGTGGTGTYTLSSTPGTIAAQAASGSPAYIFAAADTGKAVLFSYSYTGAGVAPQQKVTVTNPLLGVQPTFQLWLNTGYNGQVMTAKFPYCVANKFSFQTKLEDWTVPEIDFDIFCDPSGNLFTYSTPE